MKIILLVVAASLLTLSAALADDQPQTPAAPQHRAYVAGQTGLGVSASSAGTTFFMYGARVGYGVSRDSSGMFSLGLFGSSFGQTTSLGTVTASESVFAFGPELLTRGIFGSGLYLGGRIGMALDNGTISASGLTYNGSTTRLVVGPVVGYEIPVSQGAALTLDVSWLSAGGGTMTFPGLGSFNYNGSSSFTFQAGVLADF